MSRLGQALERAATGMVSRRQARHEAVALPIEPTEQELQPVPEGVELLSDEQGSGSGAVEEPQPAPRFREFNREYVDKLIIATTVPHALREQYRRLGANLHHAQEEVGIKTLMVTSTVPDEGKTLTAVNIAMTLSESYRRRVLLVDADLRRPSLDEVFKLPKGFGLNEALTGRSDRKIAITQISRNLALLPAGSPNHDPMSTLTSERMRTLLKEAAATFDWVILDTPPIGILTDAKLLGTMVDGALLVVRAGRTPADLVQRSVDSLGKNRILGVILNRAQPRKGVKAYSYDYTYSYYYYTSSKKRPDGQR